MMKVGYGLLQIEKIIENIKFQEKDERLKSYSVIVSILSSIDKIAETNNIPNYNTYKDELLLSIEAICELGDSNGHSTE